MSDETSPTADPTDSADAKPRVRRISNPRIKKPAASKKSEPAAAAAVIEAEPEVKEISIAAEPAEDDSNGSQDWPDAETVSDSSGSAAENKRKRRRRKGKGGGQNQGSQSIQQNSDEIQTGSEQSAAPRQRETHQVSPQPQSAPSHQSRPSVNGEMLAKKAWKIFLAEVSEEGVALISDLDARELSKRCFRLAEIFIEEQNRRIR